MAFNHFRPQIILRTLLLLVTMFGLLQTAVYHQGYFVSSVAIALILIVQIVSLIRSIENHYKQLSLYVLSLKSDDGAQTFRRLINDPALSGFGLALEQLAEYFKDSRLALEQQTLLLTTVLQHSDAAILAFDDQGTIKLCNKAFQQLILYKKPHNFDEFLSYQPVLAQHIKQLGRGDSSILHIEINGEALSLMIRTTQASIKGHKVTLVAVQDIQQELAQQEAQSWQQLIRVLTHEMANSVTPIASLANTAQMMIADEKCVEGEGLEDLSYSLATIDRRSQGLLSFIDSYRDLSQLPAPELSTFEVLPLYQGVSKLLQEKLKNIAIKIVVEPSNLQLQADKVQLEQVIINLVLNAIEAFEETTKPVIQISAAMTDRGRFLLQVSDNGCGMIEQAQQKLFLPFYTTKTTGTGIGLALSKQIINRHGGNITVKSTLGLGTTMSIVLS